MKNLFLIFILWGVGAFGCSYPDCVSCIEGKCMYIELKDGSTMCSRKGKEAGIVMKVDRVSRCHLVASQLVRNSRSTGNEAKEWIGSTQNNYATPNPIIITTTPTLRPAITFTLPPIPTLLTTTAPRMAPVTPMTTTPIPKAQPATTMIIKLISRAPLLTLMTTTSTTTSSTTTAFIPSPPPSPKAAPTQTPTHSKGTNVTTRFKLSHINKKMIIRQFCRTSIELITPKRVETKLEKCIKKFTNSILEEKLFREICLSNIITNEFKSNSRGKGNHEEEFLQQRVKKCVKILKKT